MLAWAFCIASTLFCGLLVLETSLTYPNFYSALVGLTDSALKTDILVCFACSMAILWTKLMIRIFLDRLTAVEIQVIYQRGWIFLCNVIFLWGTAGPRIYDNPYNVAVYVLSLFVLLVLHWVCNKRASSLAATVMVPNFRFIFNQVRFFTISLLLFIVDIGLAVTAVQRFKEGDYTFAMFSFVLIDLTEMSTIILSQYLLNIYSAYYLYSHEDEDEWDKLKMLASGSKFLASFAASIAHLQVGFKLGSTWNAYGSLLFRIIRLYSHGSDFLRALRAKHQLDEFTSLASAYDLIRDNTCVICRDEMDEKLSSSAKLSPRKLRCGHVMHAKCLLSWMSQSPSCPTCRQPVKSAVSSFKDPASSPLTTTMATTVTNTATEMTNAEMDHPHHTLEETTFTEINYAGASNEPSISAVINSTPAETRINGQGGLTGDQDTATDMDPRRLYTLPISLITENRGIVGDFYDFTLLYDKNNES